MQTCQYPSVQLQQNARRLEADLTEARSETDQARDCSRRSADAYAALQSEHADAVATLTERDRVLGEQAQTELEAARNAAVEAQNALARLRDEHSQALEALMRRFEEANLLNEELQQNARRLEADLTEARSETDQARDCSRRSADAYAALQSEHADAVATLTERDRAPSERNVLSPLLAEQGLQTDELFIDLLPTMAHNAHQRVGRVRDLLHVVQECRRELEDHFPDSGLESTALWEPTLQDEVLGCMATILSESSALRLLGDVSQLRQDEERLGNCLVNECTHLCTLLRDNLHAIALAGATESDEITPILDDARHFQVVAELRSQVGHLCNAIHDMLNTLSVTDWADDRSSMESWIQQGLPTIQLLLMQIQGQSDRLQQLWSLVETTIPRPPSLSPCKSQDDARSGTHSLGATTYAALVDMLLDDKWAMETQHSELTLSANQIRGLAHDLRGSEVFRTRCVDLYHRLITQAEVAAVIFHRDIPSLKGEGSGQEAPMLHCRSATPVESGRNHVLQLQFRLRGSEPDSQLSSPSTIQPHDPLWCLEFDFWDSRHQVFEEEVSSRLELWVLFIAEHCSIAMQLELDRRYSEAMSALISELHHNGA
eukprot:NODE_371_length_2346_cov_26.598607_g346_i0.p1 GENE.NODE_371_length_2346_cov_26.598607_g346_i0~~NODE_371_length_2346_cov_26.598607_g346_i0.p1  ORF type:complete len:603 (-),score=115.49 NODE_371_length_2346_cov_26.598607_g346_i0:129-1937(-)